MINRLREFLATYPLSGTIYIAYSGGLDSHVLLSLCAALREELSLNLAAIHIHHGLSENADAWADHCLEIADGFSIPLIIKKISLNLTLGESIEALARDARYAVFAKLLQAENMLLTAHHADDQAETVLMQLCRGAGPKGLSGMPMIKPFSHGMHGRPLLTFTRKTLQDYAVENKLHWIEDESNQNIKYTRNFFRHEILPLLTQKWPSIATTISRSASHSAEMVSLLHEMITAKISAMLSADGKHLLISLLLQETEIMQRAILREFIQSSGYLLPDQMTLQTIMQTVLTAGQDKSPCVKWGDGMIRRYRDKLYLLRESVPEFVSVTYEWNLAKRLHIAGVGILSCDISFTMNVTVQFRHEGESVLLPRCGRRNLNKLFQAWGVPPWERARVPLIFKDGLLVAAVGYFMDREFKEKIGGEILMRMSS